jgi:hypothetical protein
MLLRNGAYLVAGCKQRLGLPGDVAQFRVVLLEMQPFRALPRRDQAGFGEVGFRRHCN